MKFRSTISNAGLSTLRKGWPLAVVNLILLMASTASLLIPVSPTSEVVQPSVGHLDWEGDYPAPGTMQLAHSRTDLASANPSPTPSSEYGPEDNPRDRYGWYGDTLAIPDYIVLDCENRTADPARKINGWHPTRRTPSGIYMITKGTWAGFAGYRYAYQAPAYLQHQKAALLWAGGRGRSHWRSCL